MSQENLDWGRLSTMVTVLNSISLNESSYTFERGKETGHIDLTVLTKKYSALISTKHFTISCELGPAHRIDPLPVYIEDFSKNGTFVNGELIGLGNRRILAPNDVISIVSSHFKIYKFYDFLWLLKHLDLPVQSGGANSEKGANDSDAAATTRSRTKSRPQTTTTTNMTKNPSSTKT